MLVRRGVLRVGILLALLSLTLVAGCGGSSSSSSSEPSSGAEPSAQFLTKKGKNTIPKFGEESSEEEREAANAVVVESLKAREAGDFGAQCETLNKKGLEEIPGAINHRVCAGILAKFARPLAKTQEAREDRLSGAIAAFRVEGDRGYALFHGSDGQDYAMALEKENGAWKVSSINTIEI